MTTEVTTPVVDNDDLDAFAAEFFGGKAPEPEAVVEDVTEDADEAVVEETTIDEDTVATEPEPDEDPEASESEDEDDDDEEEKPQRRNRKTAKERIQELNTRAREAERREDELRERLRTIEDKLTQKDDKVAVKAPADDTPDPDAVDDKGENKYPLGEFDPAYIRDLTRWTFAQAKAEADAADAAKRETEKVAEARSAQQVEWLDRLETAKADIPDLEDKVVSLGEHFADIKPEYGDYLVSVIQSLENGPYVLDYLADNPDEAQRIVSSGATAATISLGRLDIKVSKPSAPEKVVRATKAPPPPTAAPRGTGSKFSAAPDTDDLDAFEKQFYSKKK